MVDFTKIAALAERLIEANGRSVTVTQQGSIPVDATEPWRGQNSAPQDTAVGEAVFVDSSNSGYGMLNIDNVKRGNKICLFAANNATGKNLEDFDTITDGSSAWKIVRTEVLEPGATRILYMFEVSR